MSMESKLQSIERLAAETAEQITRDYESWTSFLTFTTRFYKYSFPDQLLLYAQRPEATACAEYELWNRRMHRYVRRGSKGIALIDDTGGLHRLRYVYDISDTEGTEHSLRPFLWTYQEDHAGAVSKALEQRFEVGSANGFADQLKQIAEQLVNVYWNEYRFDILAACANSDLETNNKVSVPVRFRAAATVSTAYALLFRCGLPPEQFFQPKDFASITDFNTPAATYSLGTAISMTSEDVLRQIETTIKQYEQERRAQNERDHVHGSRGISAPEPRLAGAGGDADREVREDAENVSASGAPDPIQPISLNRNAPSALAGDREDGERPAGDSNAGVGEGSGSDGGTESIRSDEMGGADEQLQSASGGDDSGRADLQLNATGDDEETGISEAEEDLQVSMFGADDPDDNQTQETPEQLILFQPEQPSQQVIDTALRLGGNEPDSLERICAYFSKGYSTEQNAAFLQKEYGQDGKGFFIGDAAYSIWFDEAGLRISRGRKARLKYAAVIPWETVALRVLELLNEGRYVSNDVIERAGGMEKQVLATNLLHLVEDFSDEARKARYMPTVQTILDTRAGYTDMTDQLKAMLDDGAVVRNIIEELSGFMTDHSKNRDLLRFQFHRPAELLKTLHGLQREPVVFPFSESIELMPKQFISEDEIDRLLIRGGGYEHSKFRIYAYFRADHTITERTDFLKHEYGTGGSGRFGFEENHDGKGISYARSNRSHETIDKVLLPWNRVEKRISGLIRQGRYMTDEELAYIPTYEKGELAKSIYHFFDGVPQGQPHPFPFDAYPLDAIRVIQAQLDDPEKVEALYQMMLPVWAATTEDDRYYHVRRKATLNLFAFRNGTFSLFGDSKTSAQASHIDALASAEPPEDDFSDIDPSEVKAQLAASGIVGGEVVDPKALNASPFVQTVKADLELEKAKELISEYCIEEFGEEADFSDLSRVGLAYSETSDGVHEINVFADLRALKLVYAVDAEIVKEISYESMADLIVRLAADLEFDHMIAEAEDAFTTKRQELIEAAQADLETAEGPASKGTVSIPIDGEWKSFPDVPAAQSAAYAEYKKEGHRNAENFRITDDRLGEGGAKAKFQANINAIRLLKHLEAEGLQASAEQQEVLSRYVGWGGVAEAFDESKANWASEYRELLDALTPEEYAAARASVLNAHFTSPTVIRAIYEAVGNMGFRAGNILEPSMGVGNFFGLLPEEMQDSRLYGVELDGITGRIARQLYPKANITVAGFETTDRKDFFDLAVGNVPFGQYQVNDRAYNRLGFPIHDYFFAKTLDQVRPGGVIAFVTSRYTMDKQTPDARRYIAERAELLGAIRLPNNAFRANAGTDVVTDILFLQKRDRPIAVDPEWVHLGQNAEGFAINSYFVEHPEMILGVQTSESTQYGKQDFTVAPIPGTELADLLHAAVQRIRGTYQEAELPDLGEDENVTESIPADPNVKNYSFTVIDGKVYYRENSIMVRPDLNVTAMERVKGLVKLKTCVSELIDLQLDDLTPESLIREKQTELDRLYTAYTKKYGLINDRSNRLAFASDSSYYLLCSLEILDENGKLQRKADIFTKRTIKQQRRVESVDTPVEALAVSIGERAQVDLPYMMRLCGKDAEEITAELRGVIYKDPIYGSNPFSGWKTADEYLSGNVREKLRDAVRAAELDPAYRINVEALEKAQPKDLDASEIEVRLGATWIDKKYIQQFMEETFNTPVYLKHRIRVHYSSFTAEWMISGKNDVGSHNVAAYSTYGTARANAYRLLEDALNLRDIRIYDTVQGPDGKERRVLNAKQTTLAAQKQQSIRDAFKDWIWKDPMRRQELVRQYNEEMNSTRPREYDGSHITFAGMNPEITLREHQRNAIAHVLYGGNTLLAHEVGAGKTFEMVAAAMESKRLGLCNKSIFVVPNHLTEQWASEFLRLYPSANILVTSKKDFEPANRKKFCARIATGDYDAVIIGHSQFEKIPISAERQTRLLQEQIDDITAGIDAIKDAGGERFTIKQLERTRKSLEVRLAKLQADDRKDDVVTFEQLGVDRMFVDESDNYKNLFLYTKMRNVAGLSTTDAQKSSDMFAKCRYMDELTDRRGVVFATGTPVSNSMTELYTIQRYLQYDRLQQMGMGHFDCWASRFGETTTALELAPEGTGYRARTRFAKFFNLPELMSLFKEVADIKTADQLHLPTPEVEYHTYASKPTKTQQEIVKSLSERATRVHNGIDPKIDNMLKITSDGRKLGLDQRILNPMLPDEEGTKVNRCVENVLRYWEEGESARLTQLIFCDLSTPTGNDTSFSVYEDLRQKLIAGGMPKEQIAFIHDADTETKKKELFGKVRNGTVRVLIGSTAKMGAGTNVQDRLIALHDLDCPWRPRDLTQRKGRIERQGNMNPLVHVCRYVTEGTFDAYLWQTVENKQRFIAQIMTSKSPVRSCEDVDETALSFAEIKALCAGDPRIKERMDLDVDVAKLKIMKADHQSKQFRLEDNLLKYFPERIEGTQGFIRGLYADMDTLAAHPLPSEGFVGMEIRGKLCPDRESAGTALLEACKTAKGADTVRIGTYRGLALSVHFDAFDEVYVLEAKGKITHKVALGESVRGNLTRIDTMLEKIPDRIQTAKEQLDNLRVQEQDARAEVGKPFPYEQELAEKTARLIELDMQLNLDKNVQETPEESEDQTPELCEKARPVSL